MGKKLLLLFLPFIFLGCNNSIKIKGEISGLDNVKGNVKIISVGGSELTLGEINIKNGKFSFKTDQIYPPALLTVCLSDSSTFDCWFEEYGLYRLTGTCESSYYELNRCRYGAEIEQHTTQLYEMYIKPIEAKEDSIKHYESMVTERKILKDVQYDRWKKYENEISRAYRKRRLAVMVNVRKNTNNTIALGLLYNHYNLLKSKHQKEAKEYAEQYFKHSGLNWQITN